MPTTYNVSMIPAGGTQLLLSIDTRNKQDEADADSDDHVLEFLNLP